MARWDRYMDLQMRLLIGESEDLRRELAHFGEGGVEYSQEWSGLPNERRYQADPQGVMTNGSIDPGVLQQRAGHSQKKP